jgi:hypothetical protein
MGERSEGNDATQSGACGCGGGGKCGCNGAAPSHVYAIGRIFTRFPTLGVEKEFAQAVGRERTEGMTEPQVAHAVLSPRENRYLARKVCWVLSIEGLDTYLLLPRDPWELGVLIDALRLNPGKKDIDVVIGQRGPIAPPSLCNGLQVPVVGIDQVYSFDLDSLRAQLPRPSDVAQDLFSASADQLLQRIVQMADNAGATDEHRALNYLAVRCPSIYAEAARAHGRGEALASIEVRPSRLSGVRKILDVIFTFVNRSTDVPDKHFVRVDVTEAFPFLVTKLSPYYERA